MTASTADAPQTQHRESIRLGWPMIIALVLGVLAIRYIAHSDFSRGGSSQVVQGEMNG